MNRNPTTFSSYPKTSNISFKCKKWLSEVFFNYPSENDLLPSASPNCLGTTPPCMAYRYLSTPLFHSDWKVPSKFLFCSSTLPQHLEQCLCIAGTQNCLIKFWNVMFFSKMFTRQLFVLLSLVPRLTPGTQHLLTTTYLATHSFVHFYYGFPTTMACLYLKRKQGCILIDHLNFKDHLVLKTKFSIFIL